jgi:hypothetical protein
MAVALVVHPDGHLEDVDLSGDSLAAMCKAIGCALLDVVALTSRLDMWIDDEGMYTQQINPVATALARRHGFVWQPYFGPVVVLATSDAEGDTHNLTIDQLRGQLAALGDIAEVWMPRG